MEAQQRQECRILTTLGLPDETRQLVLPQHRASVVPRVHRDGSTPGPRKRRGAVGLHLRFKPRPVAERNPQLGLLALWPVRVDQSLLLLLAAVLVGQVPDLAGR